MALQTSFNNKENQCHLDQASIDIQKQMIHK